MCEFFSFITEPEGHGGRRFYFNAEQRGTRDPFMEKYDSHSHICTHYQLDEDKCNSYEYDFDSKIFIVDNINSSVDDRVQAEEWVRKLEYDKLLDVSKFYIPKDCPLKLGEEYVFRSLTYLHKHRQDVRYHWIEAMDYLVKEKRTLIITPKVIDNWIKDLPLWKIDGWRKNQWNISLDMLEKKSK